MLLRNFQGDGDAAERRVSLAVGVRTDGDLRKDGELRGVSLPDSVDLKLLDTRIEGGLTTVPSKSEERLL